jgi:chloramphenicol 3-O phosphotransferase
VRRTFRRAAAYLIGIGCPLEVLEEREKARKNRTLGQAKAQFEIIHKFAVYDLEVDTSTLSAEECAERIQVRLRSSPEAFKRLKQS